MKNTWNKFIKAKLMVPLPLLSAVVILLVTAGIIVWRSPGTKLPDQIASSGMEDRTNLSDTEMKDPAKEPDASSDIESTGETKPFEALSASEIADVTIEWFPECKGISELVLDQEQIERLTGILNRQVLYKEDLSGEIYFGMAVIYHITMLDGSKTSVMPESTLLTIDDRRYESSEELCKELEDFAYQEIGVDPENFWEDTE